MTLLCFFSVHLSFKQVYSGAVSTQRGAILLDPPDEGWASHWFESLFPGAHLVVRGNHKQGLEARKAGFQVRDAFLILGPPGCHGVAFLLRKPLSESTVAAQVLSTGTGALNIKGCRLGHSEPPRMSQHTAPRYRGVMYNGGKPGGVVANVSSANPAGRWPANLLFVHWPGCTKISEARRSVHDGTGKSKVETVSVWDCEPECAIGALDRQSGLLKSGDKKPNIRKNRGGFSGPTPAVSYYETAGDSGGASRFFPRFETREALLTWMETLLGLS